MSIANNWWHCYICDLSRTDGSYDIHLAPGEHAAKVRAYLARKAP